MFFVRHVSRKRSKTGADESLAQKTWQRRNTPLQVVVDEPMHQNSTEAETLRSTKPMLPTPVPSDAREVSE